MRAFIWIGVMGTLVVSGVAQQNDGGDRAPRKDSFQGDQAAFGAAFTEWSKTQVAPRQALRTRMRDGTEVSERDIRRKIAAAVMDVPYVAPKQPRKLLVIESLAGMYHNPGIPEGNIMVQLMGNITGAWETELNNDLSNLKYENIKKYDAIFVNSAVGEMFPDPAVRDGLVRYLREGGGLAGMHGTPWASRDWHEFAEIIGSQSAPHRIENGVLKIHDPASPIVKSFAGKDLPHVEEYYRFNHEGLTRLRWDSSRVLLTVDLDVPQRSEWDGYKRPDNVYPVTWVRRYGQGRSFYCSLGHLRETYMTPEIVGHIFAGIQFTLGDLEVDTTPNPLPAAAQ